MATEMGKIQPLRDLLLQLGELVEPSGDLKEEVGGWLFLPRGERWTLQSPAVLLELNEVPPGTENEEEVETPELAKREKLKRVLGSADVQGIISNAR